MQITDSIRNAIADETGVHRAHLHFAPALAGRGGVRVLDRTTVEDGAGPERLLRTVARVVESTDHRDSPPEVWVRDAGESLGDFSVRVGDVPG